MDEVRIDKWLWAARFFKTRGLAATAVLGGKVHVNGERVKASKHVRSGDVVEVTKGTERWTVTVTALADKRGPAAVAQGLYTEAPESQGKREQQALERRLARTPGDDRGERPTKQARRRLDALRRGQRRSGLGRLTPAACRSAGSRTRSGLGVPAASSSSPCCECARAGRSACRPPPPSTAVPLPRPRRDASSQRRRARRPVRRPSYRAPGRAERGSCRPRAACATGTPSSRDRKLRHRACPGNARDENRAGAARRTAESRRTRSAA